MSMGRQGQSGMQVAHLHANLPANTVWTAILQGAACVRNEKDDPRVVAQPVPETQSRLVEVVARHIQPTRKNSIHHPTPNRLNLKVKAKIHCPNHFQGPCCSMRLKAQRQEGKYLPSVRPQKALLQEYLPMKL